MIAPSLHADLKARGVTLSVDFNSRLRVEAPQGVLNDSLRAALQKYKSELLELTFEIEERAALMFEIENPSPEDLERTRNEARKYVLGGMASPDGCLWLKEYVTHHPAIVALQKIHRQRFGCDAEIEDVRRIA
jgi:TubC N-terminal docking domain